MHSYGKILQKACAKDLRRIKLVLELGGSLRLVCEPFHLKGGISVQKKSHRKNSDLKKGKTVLEKAPKKITQNFF